MKQHVQGDIPLSSELLQTARDEQHISRSSCGAEAALFLREYFLGLAVVVVEAKRDDFQQTISCVAYKRSLSVVFAVSCFLLFVKDLDDRIFPMLGDFSSYRKIDKDVVKALSECGVVGFQECGRETIWPDSFPI